VSVGYRGDDAMTADTQARGILPYWRETF